MAETSVALARGERGRAASALGSLSIYGVLVVIVFAILFVQAAQARIDVDLGWHLRTGQLIWESRAIPHSDPFSFTVTGKPWITHEWLSEVVMYFAYATWGYAGMVVLFAIFTVTGLWFVYRLMRSEAIPRLAAALLVFVAAFAAMPMWSTRPYMFTLLLAPLYALLLRRWQAGDARALVPLPSLMVLWVNLHGGYVFGLGLIGVYFVGGAMARWLGQGEGRGSLRALALAGAGCFLATFVNPNTYQILWYPFDTLTSAAMRRYIGDWPSPDFHELRFLPFGLLLGLFFVAAARAGRRLDSTELLLVLALAAMGLQSNRHISLFAVVAMPVLARWLRYLGDDARTLTAKTGLARRFQHANRALPGPAMVGLNWLVLVVALGFAAVSAANSLSPRAINAMEDSFFPTRAVRYIEEHDIRGRIYNAYNWGGYLVLHLPQNPVFIDSRADVYRDDFIEEYLQAYYVRPRWRETLAKYAVDYVLIESQGPLHLLLLASGEWREVYRDDVAVLLSPVEPTALGR